MYSDRWLISSSTSAAGRLTSSPLLPSDSSQTRGLWFLWQCGVEWGLIMYFNHCLHAWKMTISQSPCTALSAGICLPLGLCKGTVTEVWNTVGIPIGHVRSECSGALSNPNLYLNQLITKEWCQPIGSHVSYPTDSPIATRLGLCSSLLESKRQCDAE